MKIGRIKQIVKYSRSALPILEHGVMTEQGLAFSDLETTVVLMGIEAPLGQKYDLMRGKLTDLKSIQVGWNDFPNPFRLVAKEKKGPSIVLSDIQKHDFLHATRFTGSDELRPVLQGVHISDTHIEATDAHMLYKAKHGWDLPEGFSAIIDKKAVELIANAKQVTFYEKHVVCKVVFDCGTVAMMCARLVDGKFVSTSAIIPPQKEYGKGTQISAEDIKKCTDYIKIDRKASKEKAVTHYNALLREGVLHFGEIRAGEETFGLIPSAVEKRCVLLMPVMASNPKDTAFNIEFLAKATKGVLAFSVFPNKHNNKAMLIRLHDPNLLPHYTAPTIESLTQELAEVTKERDELKFRLEGLEK